MFDSAFSTAWTLNWWPSFSLSSISPKFDDQPASLQFPYKNAFRFPKRKKFEEQIHQYGDRPLLLHPMKTIMKRKRWHRPKRSHAPGDRTHETARKRCNASVRSRTLPVRQYSSPSANVKASSRTASAPASCM